MSLTAEQLDLDQDNAINWKFAQSIGFTPQSQLWTVVPDTIYGPGGGKTWYGCNNVAADGTLNSGVTWTPNGLKFDGNTGTVTIANGIATGSEFTLAMSITPTSSANYQVLLDESASGNGLYYRGGTGALDWYFSGDHLSSTTLTSGKKSFIAVTGKSGNISFYVNGQFSNSVASSFSLTLNRMGTDSVGLEQFAGTVQFAMVAKKQFDSQQISALYQDSLLGFPSLLNWRRRPVYAPAGAGAPLPVLEHYYRMMREAA